VETLSLDAALFIGSISASPFAFRIWKRCHPNRCHF